MRQHWNETLMVSAQLGIIAGVALGMPTYLFGLISAARGRKSWRSALIGSRFVTLVCLVTACALVPVVLSALE
jgi:hypothetical protein